MILSTTKDTIRTMALDVLRYIEDSHVHDTNATKAQVNSLSKLILIDALRAIGIDSKTWVIEKRK
jgi:hypothetical protein